MTDIEAQRQRVAQALADAQTRTARIARLLGVLITATGAALSYFVFVGMQTRDTYVAELIFIAMWMLVAGSALVIFGAGGAAQLLDIPPMMWGVFAVLTGFIAVLTFLPFGRFLASLAGFEDF